MLSSDLEDSERDRAALSKVLSTCLEELKLDQMVTVHDFPVLLPSSQPIRKKKLKLIPTWSLKSQSD